MTTPNAEAVRPDRTFGELASMLSIGAHRFLLSQAALDELMKQAGFNHVVIEATGGTLVAVGSETSFELGEADYSRRHLLAYYTSRTDDHDAPLRPPRQQLADLISRYCLAREFDPTDISGEERIDELLRSEFSIDVLDLASLVEAAPRSTDLFTFSRLAPLHLARYLFHRGHRDDISEQQRTEMWETAVVLIGSGISAEPVNMHVLESTLDDTLSVLRGRRSGRFRGAAQQALAAVPASAGRLLPDVRPGQAERTYRAARRLARRAVDRIRRR